MPPVINRRFPAIRPRPNFGIESHEFPALIMQLIYRHILRRKKILLEELEAEKAINHFATSLLDQLTIDEVFWDVTRNCISCLQFEDCVIYWLDETRNVLVQKAAYGPKNPRNYEILEPIEIPVGKGIVGTVALTGKAEIISDTTKDKRYIQDDERRLAEITVPILSGGKVVGVIDSEHSRKNFFRERHLKILTTIAGLCAHKISRVETEQAYRRAEWQLMQHTRRISEIKLQALRLQMNPHFMFNSLNSINNFILQDSPEQASLFLTKFSRLMRQIVNNSKTEWVSLQDELKALRIYVELEQLRCDNKFDVVIDTGKDIREERTLVPPLITQPYVENAIWHGLLHKKEGRPLLTITCDVKDGQLIMDINDNGIGRVASETLQRSGLTAHKTHGIKVTQERLDIVNEVYNAGALVQISDLYNDAGQAAGTHVTLTMKLKQS
jgi:two-component system LytT family sensor kinase